MDLRLFASRLASFTSRRLLPPRNVPRCLFALTFALLTPPAINAQTGFTGAPVPDPQDVPLFDADSAQRAFYAVEHWVRAGQVTPDSETVWVRSLGGVRVTVRWLGRTMGIGDALVPPQQQLSPVDLMEAAALATRAAILNVQASIDARNFRASAQADPATTRPWALQDLQPLNVDVQFALLTVPVIVSQPGSQAVFDSFAPGFHGLVLTRVQANDSREARTWPATALAANVPPSSQFVQPLADLAYEPAQMRQIFAQIGRPDGPRLGRFEIIHLVRPGEGQPVQRLVRGNVLLPPVSVNTPTLAGMADRLARFLLMRQLDTGGFTGTYLPTSDQYDPARASLADAALATYVLARYASHVLTAETPAPRAQPFLDAHERALRYLVKQLLTPETPPDPAADALALLAILHGPYPDQRKVERDSLIKQLLRHQTADGSFDSPSTDKPSAPLQALATAALAACHRQTRDAQLLQPLALARQALAHSLRDELEDDALPWLGLTEDDPADQVPPATTAPSASPPTPLWVREGWADRLRKRQIRSQPALGPDDVMGGFELGPPRPAPSPDWRTANVLIFLAHDLKARPPLQRRDRLIAAMDAGLAARFLAQLMFDEPSCYYIRSRTDVLGGVRVSLTDNRLPLNTTAATLLAVVELQQSLDALRPDLSLPAPSSQPASASSP